MSHILVYHIILINHVITSMAKLHILKTLISLEQKEIIFENSKQQTTCSYFKMAQI